MGFIDRRYFGQEERIPRVQFHSALQLSYTINQSQTSRSTTEQKDRGIKAKASRNEHRSHHTTSQNEVKNEPPSKLSPHVAGNRIKGGQLCYIFFADNTGVTNFTLADPTKATATSCANQLAL